MTWLEPLCAILILGALFGGVGWLIVRERRK